MLGIVTNRQILNAINEKAAQTMAALDDLMAADQALKNEVATFLADLAGQISGGVTPAQAEQVVADISAQVDALKAADPGPPPAAP